MRAFTMRHRLLRMSVCMHANGLPFSVYVPDSCAYRSCKSLASTCGTLGMNDCMHAHISMACCMNFRKKMKLSPEYGL